MQHDNTEHNPTSPTSHQPILVLLRHGQSVWNLENRFTGWVDVDLTEKGVNEAQAAGKKLADTRLDRVFTSVLQRAMRTADLALTVAGKTDLPVSRSEALNERHYGDLQGLNKDDMRKKYGEEQVHIWRRSYDVQPPGGESLADTCARVTPYWQTEILPCLRRGENVIVVAHGNSLRALIKEIEKLDGAQILQVEIATGTPIVYTFNTDATEIVSKNILNH